jgi:hypothetical protein
MHASGNRPRPPARHGQNGRSIVDRLRRRFGIGRVCVVADRGMISAETIAGLEARGLDYILGAREHTDKLVRQIVLDDQAPFVPLAIDRRQGETQLFVKEVGRAGVRYIVCRNYSEAANDRAVREAIVAALDAQLKRGDKALICISSDLIRQSSWFSEVGVWP